jgi:hypothetical protein
LDLSVGAQKTKVALQKSQQSPGSSITLANDYDHGILDLATLRCFRRFALVALTYELNFLQTRH